MSLTQKALLAFALTMGVVISAVVLVDMLAFLLSSENIL